ncbi:MAG: DUF4355 domain-containing protein [Clostridium sp.]
MLKKDLLKLIEKAGDEDNIDSLLENSDLAKSLQASGLTLDAFKEKMKNDKGFQKFMDSEKDTHAKKALKTLKEKGTWETEFGDVLKEKYPDLITDPTQKELIEIRKQLADEKAANARKDLLSEVMKYAKDKKLPSSIIEKCLGEDFDKSKEIIDTISKDWSEGLEAIATEKMKGSAYVPGKGPDGKDISIGAAIAAQLNKTSSAQSDPWASK